MNVDARAIAELILAEAVRTGGKTWDKIKKNAPFYVEGYAQSVAKAAQAVTNGGITLAEGRMIADHARLLLAQGIAFTTVVILSQVQAFLDGVLDIVKAAINDMLPVAIV